jgi:hypothetical protein
MSTKRKGKLPAKEDMPGTKVRPYAPSEFQWDHA